MVVQVRLLVKEEQEMINSKLVRKLGFSFGLFGVLSTGLSAQTLDDAFRYLSPIRGAGFTSESMGFTNSLLADDVTGIYGNPASLGFAKKAQFTTGFKMNLGDINSTLHNENSTQEFTNSKLNQMLMVYPFPVEKGSFVFGFGFSQHADYNQNIKAKGKNLDSSYPEGISGYLPGVSFSNNSVDLNNRKNNPYFFAAFGSYLIDTINSGVAGSFRYRSPVFGHTEQSYKNISDGEMYSWSVALESEVAKDIFIGASLKLIRGNYYNSYSWQESVYDNFYQQRPDSGIAIGGKKFVFNSLKFEERIEDNLNGYNIKIGSIVKINDFLRVGLSFGLPTYMSIESTYFFDLEGVYEEHNNSGFKEVKQAPQPIKDKFQYDLVGPSDVEISFGYLNFPLSIEGSVQTQDWTNTKFETVTAGDLTLLNEDLKFKVRRTLNFSLGIQYAISEMQSIIRGGFQSQQSPYQSENSRKNLFSFGYEFITLYGYSIYANYLYNSQTNNYIAYRPLNKPIVAYSENVSYSTIQVGFGVKL